MAADGAAPISPALPSSPHVQDLIDARLSRRGMLGGLAALPLLSLDAQASAIRPSRGPRLPSFAAVAESQADAVTVPPGFKVDVLIGWGEALYEVDAGPVDLDSLMRSQAERRFGQNNDMLALFDAEWTYPRRTAAGRMLLCANHEYFNPALMFPGIATPQGFTPAHLEAMFASMGVAVVQVEQSRSGWRVIRDAAPSTRAINRRITPFTPVRFEGPAANHPWIRAAATGFNAANPAPEGQIACGTLANCAGGLTPWGTYLSAEENFDFYFYNTNTADAAKAQADADPILANDAAVFGYTLGRAQPTLRGMSIPVDMAQYDLAKNPTAGAVYGWTIEVDPYDPTWTPRKRTALGRRKGECASTALTRDRRVAVYSGDDQINEFVYKFISKGRFNPRRRTANRDLLNEGVLYAARLEADGTGRWIALTLEAANAAAAAAGKPAFKDLGDVMVRAREAARLLGATPMDRPEDIEALHDATWTGLGPVLIACTNNRTAKLTTPGNPRRGDAPQPNATGHILRFDEGGGDSGAKQFRWDIFALAGDPAAALTKTPAGATAATDISVGGVATFTGDRFACPDNLVIDGALNAWISTDGNDSVFPCNDSVMVASAAQTAPRTVKRFLVGPVGCEICGPLLSPDETAFLCAIQHPGENDLAGVGAPELRFSGKPLPSSFPDGPGRFPRSAVVVVTRENGGKVTD